MCIFAAMHENRAREIASYIDRLTAYAQRRVSDSDLAADAVQEAVTKAVKASPCLSDSEKLLPWLYTILRNTIVDLVRKQSREIAMPDMGERLSINDADEQEAVCECFKPLLATLPSDYGEILRAIDLEMKPRESVARELGISVRSLNVKVHRAREKLREAIEETCNFCARHGCLQCTCAL